MMYAHPLAIKLNKDIQNRILASEHPFEHGFCPTCGQEVVSQKVNNLWQWVHLKEEEDDLP